MTGLCGGRNPYINGSCLVSMGQSVWSSCSPLTLLPSGCASAELAALGAGGWWSTAQGSSGSWQHHAAFHHEEGTSWCSSVLEPESAFGGSQLCSHQPGAGTRELPKGRGSISVLCWCHGNRYSFTQHTLTVLQHLQQPGPCLCITQL